MAAQVGMFYALKPLLKSKSSISNFSEFFLLTFNLRIILFHLNNVPFFNCILTKNTTYLGLLTKLSKMTKMAIFLFLCLLNLLFRRSNIKKNPGPKYSSLTFCHWNLNGLTISQFMTPLSSRYFKHI